MNEFVEMPVNKQSKDRRKMVCGVGTNDADYMIAYRDLQEGKWARCPFYRRWTNMLYRCYNARFHASNPTYSGCVVCIEWLLFSNFRDWMERQDWKGKDLDKDIINPELKLYSPETCRFISIPLNRLLCDSAANRGNLPQGVFFDTGRQKYRAECRVSGKTKTLGRFHTVNEAENAYLKCKINEIERYKQQTIDERIYAGLNRSLMEMKQRVGEICA